ncbi:hypothetical protein GA0115237_1119117 [Streptomyces sp. ScaeMP-6W]|nr:hypothetical protein GA0115237_1119117 [Streptomyces sp. ScaeMP-6W]
MRLRLREDAPGLLAVASGPRSRWTRRVQVVTSVAVAVSFLFVPAAVANPFCYIPMVCEAKAAIDFVTDPLGYLLQQLTEANMWFLRKMLELIQNTSKVDLTSSGFLKQYAIIFAASSLLTVALWLIAVAKRAVRGVGITTAVSEAIGFLLLQFVVNAMTPGAIALLMRAIDEVSAVFEPYATSNFTPFLESILKVMASNPAEGVGKYIVVHLIMLLGALLMWVELLIRSAAIYVAVALGPLVNSALVDRDLWDKSKKWFAAILAIGLSKPILLALLGLGGAILSDSTGTMSDDVSKTLVGALILLLAVFASATVYRWVPAFGDDMARLHYDRRAAQTSGPASVIDGPGQHANRAIGSAVHSSIVGGTSRTGAAKATAGAKTSGMGGGTAATGPVGGAAVAAKAGVDMAKAKAKSSPGMQGASAGTGRSGTGQGQQTGPGQSESSDAPAAARADAGSSAPVVSSPPNWAAAADHATATRGTGEPSPASSVTPPPEQPPRTAVPAPPTPPSTPPSPSSSVPGPSSRTVASTPSAPPTRPATPQNLPGRPDPSKEQ